MISQRTKAGLQAAKARGKKLGTYGKVLGDANREAASVRDKALESVMIELKHLSTRAAASEIEHRGLGRLS